jgi:apolipoprotein N-acyltransferase
MAWGTAQLSLPATVPYKPVQLRLVQPNTPEKEKFEAANARRIFDRMLDLSRRNAKGEIDDLIGIDVVIWPEEPLNFRLLQTPQGLSEIGAMLGERAKLLTGTIRAEANPAAPDDPRAARYFNSLVLIDSDGQPGPLFDKRHLVPFGEYLPYEPFLNALGIENLTRTAGGMAVGTNDRGLVLSGLPNVSPLICYEAIFPDEVVGPNGRPAWLLNITNDAWFGEQTGPYQHFHQARIRAIEQGVPLVRAAITGISAVVDARGRVQQSLPLLTSGVIDGVLPSPLPLTIYGRYGDGLLLWELLAGALLSAFFSPLGSRKIKT